MTTPVRFGRYRVTSTLGTGAMGEVYLAIDDVLGREVAIKTLRGGATGMGARLLDERFRQEARAIAQLAHPAVVQVFDLDPTADPPYLVMERVEGPSLKERLAELGGKLAVSDVVALGIQIANALAAAHERGIVHRDVKPANILVARAGMWKLADFGVAHVPDSSLTITGQFVGSPAYAPPEALVAGVASPAGDVYGLGATLYQAIAGSWSRLDGTSASALLAPIPPLKGVAPHVPDELAAAIDRAVAMDAADRPTAVQLAAALAARPSREIVAAAPTWRRYAIGGAIVLVFVVIALVATRRHDPVIETTPPAPEVMPDPDPELGPPPPGHGHGKHGKDKKPKHGPDGQPED